MLGVLAMTGWGWLLIGGVAGLMLGGSAGVVLAALLFAAGQADREAERLTLRHEVPAELVEGDATLPV